MVLITGEKQLKVSKTRSNPRERGRYTSASDYSKDRGRQIANVFSSALSLSPNPGAQNQRHRPQLLTQSCSSRCDVQIGTARCRYHCNHNTEDGSGQGESDYDHWADGKRQWSS